MSAEPLFERVAGALAGRYNLVRELGRGGMATVYLADDAKLGRQVAIKVLAPTTRAYLGGERFQLEVRLAAQLSHPHIVPLFEADEADGLLYYVMEYVDGETLADRLGREGPLRLEDALSIVAQVADALQYAHERGVIHRDIKPANVLLARGHALVTDFGVAKLTDAAPAGADPETLTKTGIGVGTVGYMSPEQAGGERRLDARSDVYALGVLLYEMLVGERPFTGPSVQAVVAKIIGGHAESIRTVRPTVPIHVDEAVSSALEKVPADRPPSARAFADRLAGSPRGRSMRPSKRQTAIAAGVVLLGLAIWGVGRSGREVSRPPITNSIAVLYFDNLSRDSADAYLADGLTEAVIARLGRLDRLTVLSQNVVSRYRDSSLSVTTAAQLLDVENVVIGQVRRVNGRIRMTVELVRASDGRHLWGEPYVRAEMNLLLLEDEIATAIATAVAGRLLPQDSAALSSRMTSNQEAYDLFLRGNYHFAQRTVQSVAQAIEHYEHAARVDPHFTKAFAQAALGHGVYLSYGWSHPTLSADRLQARGMAFAVRALQQDSTSSEAWLAKGYMLMFRHPQTFDGVVNGLQRAIALNPQNAEAHHQYAYVLSLMGDDSSAIVEYHHALRIEPDRYSALYALGQIYQIARRFVESKRWYDSALVVNPGFLSAFDNRARSLLALGDTTGARRDAEALMRVGAENMRLQGEITLGLIEAASGDTAAVRLRVPAALRLLADSAHPQPNEATRVVPILIAAGDRESALRLLQNTTPKGMNLWRMLKAREFDPLRSDPRFQRVFEESRPPRPPR